MIVARFSGVQPSTSFLSRIRAGQIGGVILFADNVAGGLDRTKALTAELQRAAHKGGNPPLLIMTDQEGGAVKRLPGPPTLAPSMMASPEIAIQQGAATGKMLHWAGINVDLAPVADVERVTDSFLGTRSFGNTASIVAANACAFARGLASEHVAYTLKHFPGLGRATANTDLESVSIETSPSDLRADYAAYSICGADPFALVMISSAIYPKLLGPEPAVVSRETYDRELPIATGRSSVLTISDDLQARAITPQTSPARTAINLGLDLALYAQTEQSSAAAYARLVAEARSGQLTPRRLRDASTRIEALKKQIEK